MIYIPDTANGEFIEDQKYVPKWQKLMQVENNCRSWQFGLSRCGQSYLHGLSQKIDCSQIMNLARCILLDGSIFVCHGIWLRFDTLVQGCVTDASPSGNVAGLLSEHLQDFVSWVPFCMEKHLTIASPAFFWRGLHQTVMENQAAISAPKICYTYTARIFSIRWGWTLTAASTFRLKSGRWFRNQTAIQCPPHFQIGKWSNLTELANMFQMGLVKKHQNLDAKNIRVKLQKLHLSC